MINGQIKRIFRLIQLLFMLAFILAIMANYPTYYVIYKLGVSAFLTGQTITQYSEMMTLLVAGSALSSILLIVLIRKYSEMIGISKSRARRAQILLFVAFLAAIALNYPTYYIVYHQGIQSFFRGVQLTQYSVRTTSVMLFFLVSLSMSYLMLARGMPRKEKVKKEEQLYPVTTAELLRLRLWRSRNQNSRLLGLIMLTLSAALFILSYETSALVFEIGSIASFIIGAALIFTQLEPKVKLYPASDTSLGPLLALGRILREKYGEFSVIYYSDASGDHMEIIDENEKTQDDIIPVGEGLVVSYERELGDIDGKGEDFIQSWLAKTITQGLGLADSMELTLEDSYIKANIVKPFVRTLCVQERVNRYICNSTGCPLMASVAQSVAKATGRKVAHIKCEYDPLSQTASSLQKFKE